MLHFQTTAETPVDRQLVSDWSSAILPRPPLICGITFVVFQRRLDEQQGQLCHYESAAAQCVGELQKAQDQVCSLQAKIRASETRNQVQPPHHHLQSPDCLTTSQLCKGLCSVCVCACRNCRSVSPTWNWSCVQPRRTPSVRRETSRTSPTPSAPRRLR